MTTAEPQRSERPGVRTSLGAHLAALAVVLLVGFIVVEPSTSFSADEGAAIVQTQLIRDGSWTAPHPIPEVDPQGRWFSLEASQRGDDGFAPYAKHPVYPWLLVPFDAVGGVPGMVALSIIGTWCASLVGALIARRLDDRAAIPTLWVLGIGSPLLFNGYLVIAHTIGAALCGVAALSVLQFLDGERGRWWRVAAACVALALAVLVRSEAVLLTAGLAVGVAVGASGPLRRRAGVAASLLVSGFVAYLVDGRLSQAVVGSTGVDPFTISHSSGFVRGRIDGFLISWVRPSLVSQVTLDQTLLVVIVLGTIGLGVALRRRAEPDLVRALALGIGCLAIVRFVLEPSTIVPGLLPAFPLLALALPLLWPSERGPARMLVVASAAFALAVLATQYSSAGSSQWGGRYFLLALPLVVPVAIASLGEHLRQHDLAVRRSVPGAVAVVLVTLSVTAVLGMREIHDGTAAHNLRIAAAIDASGSDPVVVATRAAIPRLAHQQLDDARWLLVPPDELELALERLAGAGERDVSLVGPLDHLDQVEDLAGYELVQETRPPTATGAAIRRLALPRG